ncbi:ADP-ribosylation factor-like protein 10 isoform X2 [Chelonia mydas]|uniref:ADP-ribosylation factor-like protein 10 isoform X2 n=1 Tax=Chelonia mydas TaxID=8469 RepID=UPI001CA84DF0|nr:ADP-ribosylation factor-like protein 10 isoform X2 [Chelonia mydas]
MAPPGAFGHLSLALGAAVAALGSLLFIAWRTYFPGGGRWGARWGPPPAAGQGPCISHSTALIPVPCSPGSWISPCGRSWCWAWRELGRAAFSTTSPVRQPRTAQHPPRASTQSKCTQKASRSTCWSDKGDALSIAELHQELALHTLNGQREFFLLPTSATHAALATATSIRRVKSLLVELLSQL